MIKTVIRDGSMINFWYANWHPMGPLYQKFTKKLLKCFTISKNTTIAQWWERCKDQWSKGRRFTKEVQERKKRTLADAIP